MTQLGEGGMGVVWEARHIVTQHTVALKFMRQEASSRSLFREARIAAKLQHPNIVRVLDVFSDSGRTVLVMEKLSGTTLQTRLQQGPLSESEALALVISIATTLTTAHRAGIIHRDLKPANIFLVSDDPLNPRLLDFGIAKALSPELAGTLESKTRTGAMVGTVHYMAPEQVFGEPDLNAQADIWALGVIFYEMLMGKRPFEAESMGQVIKQIALGEAPTFDPAIAPAVRSIVSSMLERDRSKRMASCEDLIHAANQLRSEGKGASLHPANVWLSSLFGLVALLISIPAPTHLRVMPTRQVEPSMRTLAAAEQKSAPPAVLIETTRKAWNAPPKRPPPLLPVEEAPKALPGAVYAQSPY